MFLVVLCHVAGANAFRTQPWVVPIIAVTNWAVPGFVAISGWYGIRFSWRKWWALWALTFFYSATAFLAGHVAVWGGLLGKVPSFQMSGGWFIGPYLALMLLAPLLNEGLEGLRLKGRRVLLGVWGGVMFLATFAWLCSVIPEFRNLAGLSFGGTGSKTIMALVVIYVTARTARLLDLQEQVSLRALTIGWVILVTGYGLVATLFAQKIWAERPHVVCWDISTKFSYDAPLTVLVAVGFFLLFRNLHTSPIVSRIASFLSPSLLAIYLIHICSSVGILLTYGIPIAKLQAWWPACPAPLVVVFVTIWCFLLCLGIDFLRRAALAGIRHALTSRCPRTAQCLNQTEAPVGESLPDTK